MSRDALKTALDATVAAARRELDLVRDDEESKIEARRAIELVRCLRRLVDVVTDSDIHDAFGAPGDWGYETDLGAALSRLYRGES